MKLIEAYEIGKDLGLTELHECVNHILMKSYTLFPEDTLAKEVDELIQSSKSAGIKFCESCGYAYKDICKNCLGGLKE